MSLGVYGGIDESNHGRCPEFFVCVYSDDISDIEETYLPKRRTQEKNLSSIITDKNFRFIIFSEESRSAFGDLGQKVIACAEFIKASPDTSLAIVDGSGINDKYRESLERILFPRKVRVDFIPDADHTYNLVNLADAAAYLFFKQYLCNKYRLKRMFPENSIAPNYEQYKEFLPIKDKKTAQEH
jgi:hypothetical protein